jgi:hypothetical protein
MAYTPPISPNINKTAGATQHNIPVTAALNEYFIPHFKKLGFLFWVIKLYFLQIYSI